MFWTGGGRSYPHHGQESVQQADGLDEALGAVAEEAGQAPQILHGHIPAPGCDLAAALGSKDSLENLPAEFLWTLPDGHVSHLLGRNDEVQARLSGQEIHLLLIIHPQLLHQPHGIHVHGLFCYHSSDTARKKEDNLSLSLA